MKKTFATYLIICITAVFLFSTCKKGSNENANLTGRWSKTAFNNIEVYTFNSDHTFEYDVFATDSVTNLVLGYRSKMTGKYSVSGSAVTMYNTVSSANKNNSYGPTTDLVEIEGEATINYTFSVEDNKLLFYFTCPPYADCVPSPLVYNKL